MGDTLASEATSVMNLPPKAPKIRITAGVGTANQKTWNLRRPVTLVGSSRLAHIVLPKDTVSRAHCILVNTGREVLLKDLHSTNGTRCNDRRADLVVLSDGDVLQLGETTVQVAIQATAADPSETEAGGAYHDPLRLPEPVTLQRPDSLERWSVERAVTIIGCRPCVAIQLDHPDISLVHAALVHIGARLAIFDLTSATGTWINRQRVTLAALNAGDRLKVGPFEMVVAGAPGAAVSVPQAAARDLPAVDVCVDRLLKLDEELQARAGELDRREDRIERERTAVETARTAVERDRQALEQEAAVLREAQAQLEELKLLFRERHDDAEAGSACESPDAAPVQATPPAAEATDQPAAPEPAVRRAVSKRVLWDSARRQ